MPNPNSRTTRREFIKLGAAAGVTAVAGPGLNQGHA